MVWNDSLQTLGTFLSSNRERVTWYWLTLYTGSILAATLIFGWWLNGGDMAWGRLTQIPRPETFNFFHAAAPVVLLLLTWGGIPVSTTFLILSVFASKETIWNMSIKSFVGFSAAFTFAVLVWYGISYLINELHRPQEKHRSFWVITQWVATGFLWSNWIMHDGANIAVYLPRKVSAGELTASIFIITFFLALIFYTRGGRIQEIVLSKTSTRFMRSATLIDLAYAFVLFFFKEVNDLPMSTTWVFVGLLVGREITIRLRFAESVQERVVIFPIVAKDCLKVIVGFMVSIALAFLTAWYQS